MTIQKIDAYKRSDYSYPEPDLDDVIRQERRAAISHYVRNEDYGNDPYISEYDLNKYYSGKRAVYEKAYKNGYKRAYSDGYYQAKADFITFYDDIMRRLKEIDDNAKTLKETA